MKASGHGGWHAADGCDCVQALPPLLLRQPRWGRRTPEVRGPWQATRQGWNTGMGRPQGPRGTRTEASWYLIVSGGYVVNVQRPPGMWACGSM